MNIAKNMEVIFVAAVALIGSASFATATPQRALAPAAIVASAAPSADTMQVVTVSAKRLTLAEKARLPQ